MNEYEQYLQAINLYVTEIAAAHSTGHAKEHAYRPALERLMSSFRDCKAVNDPKRSEHGNPDFIFLKESNKSIILGYAEAKDIDVSLDKIERTNQMQRYSGYENLFLTDYLEFRFYQNGNKYQTITIGQKEDNQLSFDPKCYGLLADGLNDFLELKPESIKSGKRLAGIMGAKARRIRDNVVLILKNEEVDSNRELEKIYKMIQSLLVHDLTIEKFADMYAQTLVYGLFVARYGDTTPDNFSRQEARDLIPKSNPFLQKFFDHIVGPDFVTSLSRIVDELCEVFSASDVHMIVHKHLRILVESSDKDPIIHFYEDFLKEYDPVERKKMGAYYTPIPVVQFIIRQVDEILKRDFNLPRGLADTSKRSIGTFKNANKKTYHRVQILDPAVGTATFLNEIIKYIYKQFEGQEGRWRSYVQQDLIPRLFGFELMMAPYTIAHLKLGMTLQETGVKDLEERLNIYLTNTLEGGIKNQQDIFSFGLAEAVSEEGAKAAAIKHERPIMVIMGNPPYSVSSNNNSEFIRDLMVDYQKGLEISNKQPLSDDYLKFIRFAQFMIDKNNAGIVSFVCNRSLLEGIVHKKVRESLLSTFDRIYITDLNGDATTNQAMKDIIDKNIFDIKQGVTIITLVKLDKKTTTKLYYKSIRGSRQDKFEQLNKTDSVDSRYVELKYSDIHNFFVKKDLDKNSTYLSNFFALDKLFLVHSSAIATSDDNNLVSFEKDELKNIEFYYRPFDIRYLEYNLSKVKGNRHKQLVRYLLDQNNEEFFPNYILCCSRNITTPNFSSVLIADALVERKYCDYSRGPHLFPVYVYNNSLKTSNFDPKILKEFTTNLKNKFDPENILDNIYAVLYSPKYREKYREFLKIDFPRIPAPKNDEEFRKLAELGKQLRELHLMTSPLLDNIITTYPVPGSDIVEDVKYWSADTKTQFIHGDDDPIIHQAESVTINGEQYFGNVPEVAWNFYIGGYQPAQKWLKDRKGRKLVSEDIVHYQKIIKVLVETDKIMQKIDGFWQI